MAARSAVLLALLAPALVLPTLLALAPGCARAEGGSLNPLKKLTTVTVSQERETGAQADAQFREILPLVEDPVVLGFLNDLGQDIVRRIEPQPFIYRFRVVVDPTLNAFALPGGYIYFHTGTLLQASDIDELAGVMAHEIAHVKGRHYARAVEKSAIPEMLTRIAALGVAVATENAAPVVIGEGLNVALQLRFTREFETEADQLGTTFMARSGYDPHGMARFFQRIVAAQERAEVATRIQPPPYLYTHPDVDTRIDGALTRADQVTVTGEADPTLESAFRGAQLRLALMMRQGVTTLRAPPPDRSRTEPGLARAAALEREGDLAGALAALDEAEATEPYDPRVPFRRGEILIAQERTREAIASWRRALLLDPSVGLNYYKIGMAYKSLGDRVNATFYLEQAERRFEKGGSLQKRTARQIERLTFPVVSEAGLGVGRSPADTLVGTNREDFRPSDAGVVWWATVGGRYVGQRDELRVRFTDPAGRVAWEGPVTLLDRPHVAVHLPLAGAAPGIWRVEALLGDDVVDRRTFRLAGPRRDALPGAAGR